MTLDEVMVLVLEYHAVGGAKLRVAVRAAVESYAAELVEAEREACAKILGLEINRTPGVMRGALEILHRVMRAIRARGGEGQTP